LTLNASLLRVVDGSDSVNRKYSWSWLQCH